MSPPAKQERERDETERERERRCLRVKRARPGVDISRTGSHIVSHCLVMEIISPRLPPPSHSHSPVSLHTAINNRIFECRRYLHISPSTSSQYLDGEMFFSSFANLVLASQWCGESECLCQQCNCICHSVQIKTNTSSSPLLLPPLTHDTFLSAY